MPRNAEAMPADPGSRLMHGYRRRMPDLSGKLGAWWPPRGLA